MVNNKKSNKTVKATNKKATQYSKRGKQQNVVISGSNEFLDPKLIELIKKLNPREQQWLYGFASDFFQYKRIATQPTIPEEVKGDKIVEYVDPRLIFKQNAQPDKYNHLPLRHGRPRKRDLVYNALKQFNSNLTLFTLKKFFPDYYEKFINKYTVVGRGKRRRKKVISQRQLKNKYMHVVLTFKEIRQLFVFSNKDFINELENIIYQKYKELYSEENPNQPYPRSMARYKITKTIFYLAMKQFTGENI